MIRLAWRFLREPDPRLLRTFLVNMAWKGSRSLSRFERRLGRGEFFPAFVFLSLTNNCNLSCQGCWVTKSDPPAELPLETVNNIIRESKAKGSFFFGLLGGEPLAYDSLFEVMAGHPDCYFQVFTNGTMLDDAAAGKMRRLGNVSPLISIEGVGAVSDERRGGVGVYGDALRAVEVCRKHRLITGVASSVCASNYSDVVSDAFLTDLVSRGVLYVWYYIYRPVGLDPCPGLALTGDQIRGLRRFTVEARARRPIVIVDAYWDHLGRALCPAAMGVSHHINPWGDIEPCPPIQFARDTVGNGTGAARVFDTSSFLRSFRQVASKRRGCVLMEDPAALAGFVRAANAKDTSGRGTALVELSASRGYPGHNLQGEEIPEKSWFYRYGKRRWFFGFGAYG